MFVGLIEDVTQNNDSSLRDVSVIEDKNKEEERGEREEEHGEREEEHGEREEEHGESEEEHGEREEEAIDGEVERQEQSCTLLMDDIDHFTKQDIVKVPFTVVLLKGII